MTGPRCSPSDTVRGHQQRAPRVSRRRRGDRRAVLPSRANPRCRRGPPRRARSARSPREHGGILMPVGMSRRKSSASPVRGRRPARRPPRRGPESRLASASTATTTAATVAAPMAPPAPVGEHPVHLADDLDVEPRPLRARSGRGQKRGNEPSTRRELQGADLEQPGHCRSAATRRLAARPRRCGPGSREDRPRRRSRPAGLRPSASPSRRPRCAHCPTAGRAPAGAGCPPC